MFYNCKLLKTINISQWNTQKVISFVYIFYNCARLEYLPNISLWKTENVIDMSHIFEGCSSLKILPDISKWNIKRENNSFSQKRESKENDNNN